MAKRILVPLDGSSLAESVLPLVADAARGGPATVRLLHVAPEPHSHLDEDGRVVAYLDQEMERLQAEGMDYLRSVEPGLCGIEVDGVVRFGDAVAQIVREASDWGADLVAVTTEGRSGLRRTVLGSVAEGVFRRAPVPVMLYSPLRPGA